MWCIGSVFASPQLRERGDREYVFLLLDSHRLFWPVAPLLFGSTEEPQELLSTGCHLRLFDDPIAPPDEQSRYLAEDASINHTPGSLVHQLVREDTAAKVAMIHDSNSILGNRLECIECRDGKLQLLFPVGENFNSVGTILCERDQSGCLCPIKKNEDEPDIEWLNGVRMSVSPTMSHPIRQLSAFKVSNSGVDEIILVARTQYQVHVLNVQREGDRVCFASHSVTTYRKVVSHVAWNPFVDGELSAVLESGEIYVYNVKSTKRSTDNLFPSFVFTARMVETGTIEGAGADKFGKLLSAEIYNLRRSWWRVEYGWHPKLLLVANAQDIILHDSRRSRFQANNSTIVLATVESSTRHCHRIRGKHDRFVAIARPEDGGYHFAVATLQHIMLFDIRRPRTPVLQWEHSMEDDFPGYLSMHPLSRLLPHRDCDDGRVILAASFRTGDVRVFCYGAQSQPTDSHSGASFKFRDLEEAYCGWYLPSKLLTCRPREFRLAAVCESISSRSQENFVESLSGLSLVSGPKTGFFLLQLTGSGDIFNQSYASAMFLKRNIAFSEFPRGVIAKNKKKLVMRRKPFSAMLSYIKHGLYCPASLPTLHQSKKAKADPAEKYQDRIYKVMGDVEAFLSVYEIAFKVLLLGLSQDLAPEAARMPSNVSGYVQVTDKTPYFLPPHRYLELGGGFVPVPIPVLLEVEAKLRNRWESFQDACDAVGKVVSILTKQQEEPVVSLASAEDNSYDFSQRLLCHSRQQRTTTVSSSSSIHNEKFQAFVGSQELVGAKGGSSRIFGRLTPDDCGASAFPLLEQLQDDFDKWQQSYTPYTAYCEEKHLAD